METVALLRQEKASLLRAKEEIKNTPMPTTEQDKNLRRQELERIRLRIRAIDEKLERLQSQNNNNQEDGQLVVSNIAPSFVSIAADDSRDKKFLFRRVSLFYIIANSCLFFSSLGLFQLHLINTKGSRDRGTGTECRGKWRPTEWECRGKWRRTGWECRGKWRRMEWECRPTEWECRPTAWECNLQSPLEPVQRTNPFTISTMEARMQRLRQGIRAPPTILLLRKTFSA